MGSQGSVIGLHTFFIRIGIRAPEMFGGHAVEKSEIAEDRREVARVAGGLRRGPRLVFGPLLTPSLGNGVH